MTPELSDFEALHAIRVGGIHAPKPDNAKSRQIEITDSLDADRPAGTSS